MDSILSILKTDWLWFAIIFRLLLIVLFVYLYKKYYKSSLTLLFKAGLLGIAAIGIYLLFILAKILLPDSPPFQDAFTGPLGVTAIIITPIISAGFLPTLIYRTFAQKENKNYSYKEACIYLPVVIVLLSFALLMLLALEGLICIIMVLPIITVSSILGANLAYLLTYKRKTNIQNLHFLAPLALLPLVLQPVDSLYWTNQTKTSISSSIIIKAKPEEIWPQVKAYSQLQNPFIIKRPLDIFFLLGLPAPQKAWIECEKVNCKRQCIFNQNVIFDESITTFKPKQELTFTVQSRVGKQNIFTGIDPHIMPGGMYFNSLKGQYRLEEIEPGITRLSGTSWYSLKSSMNWYLIPWANAIIQTIHLKVFEHIQSQVELKKE